MDTKLEMVNDYADNSKSGDSNVRADFGGELASSDGVDLNARGDNTKSVDTNKSLSRSGFTRGAAGAMAGLEAISGVGGAIRPDFPDPYVGDGNPAIHAYVDDASPFTAEGRERMIGEGKGPFNENQFEQLSETEFGDHTNPPFAPNDSLRQSIEHFDQTGEPLPITIPLNELNSEVDGGGVHEAVEPELPIVDDAPNFDTVPSDIGFTPDFDF